MTKIAQEWLDTKYSDKTIVSKIEVYDNEARVLEELTGELLIDNYDKVEEINLEAWDKGKGWEGKSEGHLTKITIKNCPKLKKFKVNNNEINEIIFESDFPDLERLDATDNKLTKIDISRVPNLTLLNITRNPITKIKGLEYSTKLTMINFLNTPGFNGQEYREWKEVIKGILNIPLTDPLSDTWKTDLETKLDELKNRPTRDELERVEKERDLRPDITLDKYQRLFNNQKPDGLPDDWQQQIADKDKYKNDLDKATEKVQEYENGLKNVLEISPNDNLPDNWQNQLAKNDDLKNKPTGTTLTAEQEKKLKDYEKMAAYLEENMGEEWKAVVQIENK